VEEREIFELIVKADEAIKYTHDEAKAEPRTARARALLEQAKREAQAIGNQGLVQQAELRLAELEAGEGEGALPGAPDPEG
jgi:hypothetical protein